MLAVVMANAVMSQVASNAKFIQLHLGNPGANGTANQASVTTRQPVTWAAPANGVLAANNQPEWPNWAGTNGQEITWASFWDQATGGNFVDSEPLDSSVVEVITNNLTLTAISLGLPVAA